LKLGDSFSAVQKDLVLAHSNIAKAQRLQADQFDKRHSRDIFQIGDLVLLDRNGINYVANESCSPILLQAFLGPFRIVAVDHSLDNYTLDLPPSMRCHRTFSVRVLKRYFEPHENWPDRAGLEVAVPVLREDGIPEWEVKEILDVKWLRGKWLFWVSWVGYADEANSWEPFGNLSNCPVKVLEFLEVRLENGSLPDGLRKKLADLKSKFGPGRV
jgi:hypothetical protein